VQSKREGVGKSRLEVRNRQATNVFSLCFEKRPTDLDRYDEVTVGELADTGTTPRGHRRAERGAGGRLMVYCA
jgi:hypothetical protein